MKAAILAACTALVLAGFNSADAGSMEAATPKPNSIRVAPRDFKMPEGGGCTG